MSSIINNSKFTYKYVQLTEEIKITSLSQSPKPLNNTTVTTYNYLLKYYNVFIQKP